MTSETMSNYLRLNLDNDRGDAVTIATRDVIAYSVLASHLEDENVAILTDLETGMRWEGQPAFLFTLVTEARAL